MNVKLTAQQKSKPIYTAPDHASRLAVGVYAMMQPILLRENKVKHKEYYSFVQMGMVKALRNSSPQLVGGLHQDEVELLKEKLASEARMERNKEIALSLLKDKMPIDFVVKASGLKKKVVENITKAVYKQK
jgi:hypothetical protein